MVGLKSVEISLIDDAVRKTVFVKDSESFLISSCLDNMKTWNKRGTDMASLRLLESRSAFFWCVHFHFPLLVSLGGTRENAVGCHCFLSAE